MDSSEVQAVIDGDTLWGLLMILMFVFGVILGHAMQDEPERLPPDPADCKCPEASYEFLDCVFNSSVKQFTWDTKPYGMAAGEPYGMAAGEPPARRMGP
jgi:hypothetical protein